jgi:hypothetical protein
MIKIRHQRRKIKKERINKSRIKSWKKVQIKRLKKRNTKSKIRKIRRIKKIKKIKRTKKKIKKIRYKAH